MTMICVWRRRGISGGANSWISTSLWPGICWPAGIVRNAGHNGCRQRNPVDALSVACDAAFQEACRLWNGGEPRQVLVRAQRGLNGNSYRPEAVETAFQQWSKWLTLGDARSDFGRKDRLKLHLFGATTITRYTNKRHAPPVHAFFQAAQKLLDVRERLRRRWQWGGCEYCDASSSARA